MGLLCSGPEAAPAAQDRARQCAPPHRRRTPAASRFVQIARQRPMASSPDTLSMALFCDFENVALGVRDAKYEKFDIKPVLERLLLKGSIVVKKAYCDWDRYKAFKATMHEANFELIEIPHVRQSGKNSADIRLVVDALDLCYTKSHVNTFVIISGDSDFSPLVSKLRENAKQVIGVGVKNSTQRPADRQLRRVHLLRRPGAREAARHRPAPACRRAARATPRARGRARPPRRPGAPPPGRCGNRRGDLRSAGGRARRQRQDLGLGAEGSHQAPQPRLQRRCAYGFRSFGNLLEEAQALRLLAFGRDEKSGAYVFADATGSPVAHGAGRWRAAGSPNDPKRTAPPQPRRPQIGWAGGNARRRVRERGPLGAVANGCSRAASRDSGERNSGRTPRQTGCPSAPSAQGAIQARKQLSPTVQPTTLSEERMRLPLPDRSRTADHHRHQRHQRQGHDEAQHQA
jgi:uncharacterized LabA/DUF88 family protein